MPGALHQQSTNCDMNLEDQNLDQTPKQNHQKQKFIASFTKSGSDINSQFGNLPQQKISGYKIQSHVISIDSQNDAMN